MSLKLNIVVAVLAVFGYLIVGFLNELDVLKSIVPYNNKQCTRIDGSIGNEDIQLTSNNILFLSSDNKQIFPQTPVAAAVAVRAPNIEDGAIYYIDLNVPLKQQTIKKIKFNRSYPATVEPDFHPHGIYVSENTRYLYVISHGRTGEAVFVFQVYYDHQQLPSLLDFLYVIHDPVFTGVNNDITAVLIDRRRDTDHIHVDNFEHTLYISGWTGSTIDQPAWMYYEMVTKQSWGYVAKCTVVKHSNSTNEHAIYVHQCNKIMEKLPGPNGIGVSNDNQTLVVALTSTKQIQLYHIHDIERHQNTSTTIQPYQTIQSTMAVDNINMDRTTGDIIIAGHPKIIEFMKHSQSPLHTVSPNQVDTIQYIGQHQYANVSTTVFMDQGELVSASSAAERYQQYLYIGGVHSKGVLACQIS